MSLRPAVRREGPLEQVLLMALVIVLGATFMLWLTGQVSGFVHSGQWPKVSLPEMGMVVTKVPRHPFDPAAAWPKDARRLLPGPVLFWATFMILLVVLGAAWVYLSAAGPSWSSAPPRPPTRWGRPAGPARSCSRSCTCGSRPPGGSPWAG
jgi:hypothetical protein